MADNIGRRLKRAREDLDLTQEQVCRTLEDRGIRLAAAQLSRFESNKRLPTVDVIIALSQMYRVSVDYLLMLSDNDALGPDRSDPYLSPEADEAASIIDRLPMDMRRRPARPLAGGHA